MSEASQSSSTASARPGAFDWQDPLRLDEQLDEDERLWCWGANLYGQLGRDSNADAFSSPSLVELPAGRRIARLDAKEHVCALLDDGSVHCWGRNDAGQSDWSDEASIVVVPTVVQGLEIEPEVIDEVGDVIGIAVRMLALETAERIFCIRLEVASPGIECVGMLFDPRASDVMLSAA